MSVSTIELTDELRAFETLKEQQEGMSGDT